MLAIPVTRKEEVGGCNAEDGPQGLMYVWQVLYHLSYIPRSFIFFSSVLMF
jgi:hypothetical protein